MGQYRKTIILLPFICWFLLYHQALFDMMLVWRSSKTYEHGFLIVPICLWVAWQQRQHFLQYPHAIAWLPVCMLPLANLLWIIGYVAHIALFEHVAAIASLQLLLWALMGTTRAKVMWFPLCFLVFCVPFGEQLIAPLQTVTATLAVFFLQLFGIPVFHDALSITIPNGHFFVAEACSGIRFLISSLAIGCLFAYLQFSKPWKRIAFIAFSFVFPILANGIRATGIILIGYFTDMEHATGADHLIYGWVFFSLVLLCIFGVAHRFADPLPPTVTIPPSLAKSSPSVSFTKVPRVKAVGIITAVFLSFTLWGKAIVQSPDVHLAASPMLSVSQPTNSVHWGITFPKALDSQSASIPDSDTYFYTARYALWQEHGELISSENSLFDNDIWSVTHSQPLALDTQTQANSLQLIRNNGTTVQLVYWYCINAFCSHDPITIKLFKAGLLLLGGQGHADIFAIVSPEQALSEHRAKQWRVESTVESSLNQTP